jgi:hypothetical protein
VAVRYHATPKLARSFCAQQKLAQLSEHADVASISAREFQQAMYAAMSKEVSESDFTSGMDNIAGDLVAASQGATGFTRLLEANGMAIKANASDADKMKQALLPGIT